MGWGLGWDSNWSRDIGYDVPAHCDHPGCRKVINRGLSHVCGGEPCGGEYGCGLYFCERHLYARSVSNLQACARCLKYRKPFKAKPDHKSWTRWKMKHWSWWEWRKENGIPEPNRILKVDPDELEDRDYLAYLEGTRKLVDKHAD